MGYKNDYIMETGLNKERRYDWQTPKAVCFLEPLEVKVEGEDVYWRENETRTDNDIPDYFHTQLGYFSNYNNGEFDSWLAWPRKEGPSDESTDSYFNCFIEGNFCDMFDLGDYIYAIDNNTCWGLGDFRIVKIDRNLKHEAIYDNDQMNSNLSLFFLGRYEKGDDCYVLASGWYDKGWGDDVVERFNYKTIIFCIGGNGEFHVVNEWETKIPFANSFVVADDYAYIGHNKMITRLNLVTGETEFYTNKSSEEIAAMVEVYDEDD